MNCENCKHLDGLYCRRYPPVPVIRSGKEWNMMTYVFEDIVYEINWEFPHVLKENESCGEWSSKDEI